MKMIQTLKNSFTTPLPNSGLTEIERVAMGNLIKVVEERLWIAASHPKKPAPIDGREFSTTLEEVDVDLINKSIHVVKQLINQNTDEST